MDIQAFIDSQPAQYKEVFAALHQHICAIDSTVDARIGPVMGIEDGLVYKQEGVFKYGITRTKKHFSFHSMVMYTYPELREDLKQKTKGIKFQKGCLNFSSADQIDHPDFVQFLKDSAQKDFGPVLRHYQNKKK